MIDRISIVKTGELRRLRLMDEAFLSILKEKDEEIAALKHSIARLRVIRKSESVRK
jgi:hypothetical protein